MQITQRTWTAAVYMSNVLFNAKQDSKLPHTWRVKFAEVQAEFDAAKSEPPAPIRRKSRAKSARRKS